ncbi:18455_t:CDS:2 [Funneliformis geosporum]|uniref:16722_t:CDS:1 n=1 Tax=Funneliformis geosporum TaxID=1117311 RepID=A0A9W4SWF9_9GLOM|nr:16722_t:CDS:2 [Funneliformis geosporum]CAI2183900.1 18455_t:CDS:2 [Funneliformis geosporum]
MELAQEKTILNTPTRRGSSKADQGMNNMLIGSIAGMAGKLIEYPFDTIKTRLQSQSSDHKQFKGPLDCFRQTLAHEGYGGLYRGLSSPLVGAMLENACLFLAYNHIQTMIREYTTPNYNKSQPPSLTMSHFCISGALSGSLASFLLTPVELIKCKLQVQETFLYGNDNNVASVKMNKGPHYNGPWSVIKYTLKHHGISGLYRGHSGTFIRESVGGAAWFGTYEFVSSIVSHRISLKEKNVTKNDLSMMELISVGFLGGASAGMAYNLLIYPVDSIKSQMQTDEEVMRATGKEVVKRGFCQVGRELYKNDGIKGFYRGCGITIARAVPSNAIIFTTYVSINRGKDGTKIKGDID